MCTMHFNATNTHKTTNADLFDCKVALVCEPRPRLGLW